MLLDTFASNPVCAPIPGFGGNGTDEWTTADGVADVLDLAAALSLTKPGDAARAANTRAAMMRIGVTTEMVLRYAGHPAPRAVSIVSRSYTRSPSLVVGLDKLDPR